MYMYMYMYMYTVVICNWLKKLNCPPMCDNSLHMPLKCMISFHVRGACAEHDFLFKASTPIDELGGNKVGVLLEIDGICVYR